MLITRPDNSEYPAYFEKYVSLTHSTDLIKLLKEGQEKLKHFMLDIPVEKLDYRYAEGKWNIPEIMMHLIDCERVFAYRALCFARKDKSNLPGFDEDNWAAAVNVKGRTLKSLLDEYDAAHNATIALFENMNEEAPLYTGTANGNIISVRSLGYIICGHELHHIKVIKERYL